MEIKNNIIKQYLRNVYFITGTPCGGKTTISRALAKRYGFVVYDVDAEFDRHKSLSNCIDQPCMNMVFSDADEFFLRPYKVYGQWLMDNTREQLDFIILDLIRLSQSQTVICDIHLTLDEAMAITVPERIVFLLKNPKNLIDEYCNRKDHEDFNQYVNSASTPVLAKQNCNKTLEFINRDKYENIKRSQYFWLKRDDNRSIETTLKLVEKHFNFS